MFNIVYREQEGRRRRLDFEGVRCVIGNDRRCDFYIPFRILEKEHALITFDPRTGVSINAMRPSAAVWVNGERIDGPTRVQNEDEIVIGNYTLWVLSDRVEAVVAPPVAVGCSQQATVLGPSSNAGEAHFDLINHWGGVIHARLIKQMDLRRIDVHRMSDEDLRQQTASLLDEIVLELESEIPSQLNLEIIKLNVLNEAVGLGPLEKFLADDTISEIMVNNYREVFVERGGKLVRSEYGFSGDHAVLSVIERIITPIGRRIDESSPMVDARLKDGSRVNAVIPPLALKGPSLTIRKFSKHKLAFEDLVKFGSVSAEMVEFLQVCVQSRRNIIVSGGTGSGKTTLLNVLSSCIPDDERIVTVEDAAELKLDQPNLVSLEAKPANIEGKGQISIRDLVKNTLRMRPDRIVVGECRGGEALDMLQAMNTGHDGSLTTAHANSPRDLVSRLEVMVLMGGMDLPISAIREQVASAVDLVVQQTRYPCGSRKISRITEVAGIESGTVQLQDIFLFDRTGYDGDGKVKGQFTATGFVPSFYEELKQVGTKVDLSIFRRGDQFGEAPNGRF